MLRSGASRSLLRSLTTAGSAGAKVTSSPIHQQLRSQLCTLSSRTSALSTIKPLAPRTLAQIRFASTSDRKPVDHVDAQHETELGKEKLEAHPELVSSTSSAHAINSELGAADPREEDDTDMMAGIRGDLKTIQETFSLHDVPRQAYYMGMAGVLPYMATSLSTVYCAWEINHAETTGSGFFMSEYTAEAALHIIEPLQVGYGALIISFLGAIHWGLEWAAYGGTHGYPRYMIGVVSTALAWPTILLPVEYALISQFLVFNFLYYADSRACKRGWAPQWYGVYRFVLTFIVGSAIVASLIGRGQIHDKITRPPGTADRIRALREVQYDSREEEEQARKTFLKRSDDEEDEDEEEDDE